MHISKLVKFIIGIVLLPSSIGAVMALYAILREIKTTETVTIVFLAGMIVWTIIYAFLPSPNTIYVFGHEMTHAFWSLLFKGKLKEMRVSSEGGYVLTTSSNFLTTLAPYFFPFYAVLVLVVFFIGSMFWDWSSYSPLFYFLLGLAYAFHLTLTFNTLKIRQTDISLEGYVFSSVIILLGNILTLLFGIAILNESISAFYSFDLWIQYSTQVYNLLYI
ncbi:MAG: hypothetical protein WCX79_04275 [Candidatus Paceibacterota bacterium]|jgi:hypothetical protein